MEIMEGDFIFDKNLMLHLKEIKKGLKPEFKKINIRSIYKGILDIFSSVFKLNLNDTYNNKMNNIISEISNLPQNEKVKELKAFLLKLFSNLQEGNNLVHSKLSEPSFSLFGGYEILKNPFIQNLSLIETINYAYNDYINHIDINLLIKNIKFSREELKAFLI